MEMSVLAIFFLLLIVAAREAKQSFARLADSDKAKVVDLVAKTPYRWLVAMVSILSVWMMVLFRFPRYSFGASILAFGLVLGLSVTAAVSTYRRYRDAGLPPEFLKSHLKVRSLRMAGSTLMLGTITSLLLRTPFGF